MDPSSTPRGEVQRRAADTVNRQKHEVADRLDAIVHALHAARNSLSDDDQQQIAQYVGDLTDQVERGTRYLRNNEFGAMMRDMEDVAQNNAGVFLGSTFVAGVAIGRFLRTSKPEQEGSDWRSQVEGDRSFSGEPGGSYDARSDAANRGGGNSGMHRSYQSGYGTSGFQANTFGSGGEEQ